MPDKEWYHIKDMKLYCEKNILEIKVFQIIQFKISSQLKINNTSNRNNLQKQEQRVCVFW